MPDLRPARDIQDRATKFFTKLGWTVNRLNANTLRAVKMVAGNELRWALLSEDEISFAQLGEPRSFIQKLMEVSIDSDFFDFIGTERIFRTRRWSDEIKPLIDQMIGSRRSQHYGTWKSLLNRFAKQISTAQTKALEPLLEKHFIRKTVRTCFTDGNDALTDTTKWLSRGDSRIMLVTGDPGAGKSVFALSLALEINALFSRYPERQPAAFLIWFSVERPAALEELISIILQDLGITDHTVDSVKFLLSEGQIVFILDGFDEISRALAHRAEETIDNLSVEINKRTNGRLILTSRPAFLTQENIFSDLTTACEEDRPNRRDVAPYTDEQQREWVVQNAPDHPDAHPPDRHWQRIQTAFAQNDWLRNLCRTPVYLRMLSEVLIEQRSIQSRDDLITKFCAGMWERERGRRSLLLSDSQYLLAYEAISAAIVDVERIPPENLREWLELYIGEDANQLLAELPEDYESLLKDISIGPLTGGNGYFGFEHEIFTGYFFAKLLARTLRDRGRRFRELWNREIYEPAWAFLPESVRQAVGEQADRQDILTGMSREFDDGLLLWNLTRAMEKIPPRNLFQGKYISGVIFEDNIEGNILDLRSMVFDSCKLHDVTFIRCDLEGATFRGATIGRMKFFECEWGAVFDNDPVIADEAQVTIVRSAGSGEELYLGDDIRQGLAALTITEQERTPPPQDMAEKAAIVVFKSLYKVDGRRLDYPEPKKFENRLRAWLRGYDLDSRMAESYFRILVDMSKEFENKGWICQNQNRSRTRVPCTEHQQDIERILRFNRISVDMEHLREIVAEFQDRLKVAPQA